MVSTTVVFGLHYKPSCSLVAERGFFPFNKHRQTRYGWQECF